MQEQSNERLESMNLKLKPRGLWHQFSLYVVRKCSIPSPPTLWDLPQLDFFFYTHMKNTLMPSKQTITRFLVLIFTAPVDQLPSPSQAHTFSTDTVRRDARLCAP